MPGSVLAILSRNNSVKQPRSVERFSGRSHAEYRRLFNRILSSSGEGRITLAVLKDISRMLQRFYGCRTIEIVYKVKQKLLHAKTVRGRSTITSGWKEKQFRDSNICDLIESIPSDLLGRFKTRWQAEKQKRKDRRIVYLFPEGGPPAPKDSGFPAVSHVFLLIPDGSPDNGVLAMSFGRCRTADHVSKDFLNRLASVIGLTLSHNLSRFQLRERVKELTCMYSIANLAVSSGQSVDGFLQQVAELLPPAYLYPEITEARITFENHSYRTAGFAETQRSQKAPVVIGGTERGKGRDYEE